MSEPVIDYQEAVLEVVRLIPSGHVLSYGDIAEILDHGGPRQVGAVMAASRRLPQEWERPDRRATHGAP
ncbi:MGMT family protein [Arthrobacter sp. H5]|uniref:MGMT family protein n=1 Tax=Arthrobacter sp. H5 TaxID=1267973 RepID=UPI0004871911